MSTCKGSVGTSLSAIRRLFPTGFIVFFSILLIAELAIFCFGFLDPVVSVIGARDWVATPCEILSSKVVSVDTGSEGVGHSLSLHYGYRVGDREYESTRYDFTRLPAGKYEEYLDIVSQYRMGTMTTCYVNPLRPSDAVLERRITPRIWRVLTLLAIVSIAALVLAWMVVYTTRLQPKIRPLAEGEPPWLAREDWASGRIRPVGKRDMANWWCLAGIWNAITFPVIFLKILPEAVRRPGNGQGLFGLPFLAVGLGLLWGAIRATLCWRRFKSAVFEMASVPAVVGGSLEGTIRLGGNLRPGNGCCLQLSCNLRNNEGSATFWTTDRRVGRYADVIPVLLLIPGESRETNPDANIYWQLRAFSKVSGLDLRFEVPVYKIGAAEEHRTANVG